MPTLLGADRSRHAAGLAERERTNPQFSFLKETHSLFGFFTSLCDAYSSTLMPAQKDLRQRLHADATNMCAPGQAAAPVPSSTLDAAASARGPSGQLQRGARARCG